MKNFSGITDILDITTKKYVDDNKVTSVDGLSGGTLTSPLKISGGDQSTASKISLNQSANGQITDSSTSTLFGFMSSTTLTVGGNGYVLALRGSGTRPTYKDTDLALKSDIPTKVSELTNDSGFTTNKGTITGINMNGASKGTSGVVDLGTVLTDAGGTFTGPVSSKSYYKSENADLRTSTTLSHIAVNVDNGRTNSHTAYMNGQINIKSASSSSEKTITIPDKAGTIALTSDIHDGTLTIQKNGETVGTFTANQKDGTTANITVPTKASDVNALSLDGGTIKKSKTIKMDASANSDGANLKWGTVSSKNPYIGYASDQSDGTFIVSSLLGTDHASGLAIGGSSGNLLWKGTKVATTSDIPDVSGKANLSGTNNFTGSNTFTDNNVAFIGQNGQTSINGSNVSIQAVGAMGSAEFSVKTDNNNKVFEVISDADNGAIHLNRVINIDNEQQGNVPLCIGGTNAGASGQVLTSQGTGETPTWTTLPITSATLDVANKTLYLTLPSGS